MARYILRRLLWAIPIIIFVTFLAFVALRIGTDPVNSYLRQNPRASAAKIAQYRAANGLNGSLPEQYFHWFRHFVTGKWGRSIKGSRPVWPELKHAFGNTLVLGGLATFVGIAVGVAIGVIAALRQYSKFDSAASTGAFIGLSIPPYISAILLQLLFAVYLTRWLGLSKPFLPTSGVYPPGHKGFDLWLRLKYLVLPTIVVAIQIIAVYSRYMRASLLDVINSEYLRTARAKGISERRVIVRHAMRNALIPVTTQAALDIGAILGGLIITERIFEYKGLGDYFLGAFNNGEFPLMMPWLAFVVFAVIFFNLLADILYAWLDPRIRID